MKNITKSFLLNRQNKLRLFLQLATILAGVTGLFGWHTSAQMQSEDGNKTSESMVRGLDTSMPSAPQPAIFTATSDSTLDGETASDRVVVFNDANAPGSQNLVTGLPTNAKPHGVSLFSADQALVCDFDGFRIFVVRLSTASLVSTIDTAGVGYEGWGTIAVAPSLTKALAMGGQSTMGGSLKVIQAPYGSGSTITQVALPGEMKTFQTQGIVFNNAGRAFVYHTTGISVLDPPYASISFTIPVAGNEGGAIAITPDGNTLLTTNTLYNDVQIFNAPFSAASTSTSLLIPNMYTLDGIMVAPNGANAIVVTGLTRGAASITAPFTSSSTVEILPVPSNPTGGPDTGFEDVGISADSQIAILAGDGTDGDPAIVIRAPFTTVGAVSSLVPINGVAHPGRGNGAVRFASAAPVANVVVGGRVLTADGRGLRNATVSITDSAGMRRTAITSSFGFYTFDNVRSGEGYTVAVSSRFFRFAPRVVQVDGNLSNLDFMGLE